MRKNLGTYVGMTVMLSLITIFTFAQDVVVLTHKNYTTHYSKSKHYPVMVEWWETKSKVGCPNPLPRKDKFASDPLLPKETDLMNDYVGSGLDRGHMMPAKSNQCQTQEIQDECFYFSNMSAQYHSLNAGDWKSVEVLSRDLAFTNDSVHVWAGNVGVSKKIGSTSVPTQCWKVIYVKKGKQWLYFIFNNDASKPDGIHNNQVEKKDVEKLSGFKFK